jgi:hypothetical protein
VNALCLGDLLREHLDLHAELQVLGLGPMPTTFVLTTAIEVDDSGV